MRKILILLLLLASFIFFACDGGGSSSGSIVPVEASSMPDCLAGGSSSSGISRAGYSEGLSTYDDFIDEYSNFYVVGQIALNYNDPLEWTYDDIESIANSSRTSWTTLSGSSLFTKQCQMDDETVLNANEDFSAWETVMVNDEVRRHLRVVQKNGYVLSTLMITYAGPEGSTESLEIIESDDYLYTKIFRVRNPDGDSLKSYNPDNSFGADGGGFVYFDMYAGITKKDAQEHTLGIKRYDATEMINTTASDFTYEAVGDIDGSMVAAFDDSQLMIRPAVTSAPLSISVVATDNPSLSPEYSVWPDSQGESFDASLFPDQSDVEKIFDLGATAAYASKGQIFTDYSYDYPGSYIEWSPSDIGLE